MGIVYHGSKVPNLLELSPNISMHGKSLLYATEYKQIALAYLGKFDSLTISQINHKKDGIFTGVSMVERRKNILRETYENVTGFLYILDDANFKKDMTEWDLEVVSDKVEKVLDCIKIDNVLKELENTPNLRLYYYPDRPDYIPTDDSDMVTASIESYEISKNIDIVKRYFRFFPHLETAIRNKFLETYGVVLV
jgi:hypothetical protein